MTIMIKAYKCEKCGQIYQEKKDADNCCKCTMCKHYIGKIDKNLKLIYCSRGYACDSYSSKGKKGTFSKFK